MLPTHTVNPVRSADPSRDRYRSSLVAVLVLLALAGTAGGVQLIAGVATPPVDDLAPLGLTSWVLPGLWLLASVAVPSAAAAVAVLRRGRRAVGLALLAAGLLGVELVVQIPFVGPSVLQLVMGLIGGLVVVLASKLRTPSVTRPEGR